MKLNKLFTLSALLALIALGGCTPNNNTNDDDANKKLAYASSSALALVNTSSSSIPGVKTVRGAWSPDTTGLEDTFSDLVAQFDTLFDAQRNVEVTIIENEGGEFAYTSNIAIGENKEFTYSLNYNQEVVEGSVTQDGELVVNYVPLSLNLTLNYESSVIYDNDNGTGHINFKLYFDLTNKENTSTYIEVNEVIDSNNLTANRFDYALVINDQTILDYSIEIPVAEEDNLVLKMGELTFEVSRDVNEGETTITISSKLGDVTLFTISFHKNVDEDGKVTYSIATAN